MSDHPTDGFVEMIFFGAYRYAPGKGVIVLEQANRNPWSSCAIPEIIKFRFHVAPYCAFWPET